MQQKSNLIFLVDDDPVLGDITKSILELSGFQIRFFLSPTDALKAVEEEDLKPDLLVTDFNMPELNGLQLIARCRAACPVLKSLLLSGTARSDELRREPIKADAFLPKPFLAADLLETIRRLSG